MNQNPYSSPAVTSLDDEPKRSVVCTVMFWLSGVLALVLFAIAVNGGYQYWLITSRAGMKVPPHLLAAVVCDVCSGLGMLYSATRWRRQLPRAGTVAFACSWLAFFATSSLLSFL